MIQVPNTERILIET